MLMALSVISRAQDTPQPAAGWAGNPDSWLVGSWGTQKTHISIRRDGSQLVWNYRRDPGAVNERWGEKVPATAEGAISSITGCKVEMKGRYTSYSGATPHISNRAVGSSMDYVVTFDGGASLSGRGIGFGRQWFDVVWRRAP